MTETWLTNEDSDELLDLNNFVIFRKDRDHGNDKHGGVLIAVKSNLNPNLISIETELELCFINIKVSGVNYKLGVVYRPPSSNRAENEALYNILKNQLWNQNHFFVTGDFNFRNINWNNLTSCSPEERHFLDVVHELNLTQNVREPTRQTAILDLCLSPNDDSVVNLAVKETFSTSDHSYFTFDVKLPINVGKKRFVYRDYKDVDYELLHAHLATIDWDSLFTGYEDDCNMLWGVFQSVIDDLVIQYVPIKEFSERNAPWFTPHLKRILRTKQRKYNKYKNNSTNRNFTEYMNFCVLVKNKINSCKAKYEKRKFLGKNQNPKQFFDYINRRTKRTQPVANLVHDGRIISDDSEKAEILLQQYCSVFTADDGTLPECPQSVPINTLCDMTIDDLDIVKAIRQMNRNSAPGPDGIHPKFITKIYSYLIKPLKQIFNVSLSTGIVPDTWKFSEVIPIYKNNRKPNQAASYRPVSLTSYISKLLEKIIHVKLLPHLNQFEIISNCQHGFLAGRSTTTNLLKCFNDWTSMLEDSSKVDVLYIDLAKAFDSVSHDKLLYKLTKIGIGGNLHKWFTNFLTGRSFNVKVDEVRSRHAPVGSGIPQGTILGPLLFILFINNVSHEILNSQIQLYADDSKMYSRVNNIEQFRNFNNDIVKVNDWFESWQLKINFEKCEILHMGHNNFQYQYAINDNNIPAKEFCRDLGVCVDKKLSFDKHCLKIACISHYKAKQFYKSFTCHDIDLSMFLYKTYIRPVVESGTQVWSPYYKKDIDIIENVQRRFTKFLPGYFDMSYVERLRHLNLKSLEERRIANDVVFVYKIIHGLVDVQFDDLFSFNTNSTRGHSMKLNVNRSRLDIRKNFFCNRVIKIWNSLNESVVSLNSSEKFKDSISSLDLRAYCRGRAFMS